MINGTKLPPCDRQKVLEKEKLKQVYGGGKLNHVLALDKINLENKDMVVAR